MYELLLPPVIKGLKWKFLKKTSSLVPCAISMSEKILLMIIHLVLTQIFPKLFEVYYFHITF